VNVALIAWITLSLSALIVAGVVYQWVGQRRDARRWPPPGRMVSIGDGRKVHFYALGDGAPAVVLEAGISATSLNWRGLQQTIAPLTRVLAYDRGGLGWSDPGGTPRTASNLAVELHSALRAAGVEAPYVLVGHSFGGLVVRRFASLYPGEVAGLVLVDALPPEEWSPLSERHRRMLAIGTRLARRGAFLARIGLVRLAVRLLLAGSRRLPQAIGRCTGGHGATVINRIAGEVGKMPREVWPMVAAHWSNPRSFLAMAAHFEALPASAEEVRAAAPANGIPVTVLTAGKNPPVPEEAIRAIGHNVRHVVARESGHWIHLDQPDLVAEAVLEMVEAARQAKTV
jgi:pimeloyl-ACP methyl ester carboxylesterase